MLLDLEVLSQDLSELLLGATVVSVEVQEIHHVLDRVKNVLFLENHEQFLHVADFNCRDGG
jgi:hypothetical protein